MIYQYWIEFDDEGDIKSFYKHREECKNECQEFIVKLIPVDRTNALEQDINNLGEGISLLGKELKDFNNQAKRSLKVVNEITKVVSKIKHI